ncbi:flagellar assembly protein FliW [Hydrogenimonas sp.]
MQYQAVLPILGFNDVTSYRLEKIDDIFYRFASTEADTPSFTLIQPAALRDDYAFELPESAAERLGLAREEDALVLNLMILDTPLENSHVNFLAPLVFNTANGKMGQVVLDSAKYPGYGLADPLRNFLAHEKDAS